MDLIGWYRKRKKRKARKSLVENIRASIHLDRDILTPEKISQLESLAAEAEKPDSDTDNISSRFEACYGAHTMRGLLDVLLVALTVAFGVRTLALQPFQIPTGSMQPTLFGIHYIDAAESERFTSPLVKAARNIFETEVSGNATLMPQDVQRYLDPGATECNGVLSSGDHLFVDRVSFHFKPFERGEILIFNTEGLMYRNAPLPGFFYIKRLVGMPGDTLRIDGNMLMIRPAGEKNFRPATDFSPRFEKLYSGKGGYHGHVADGALANGAEITVPADCYYALGDNSRNSLDSRYWGAVPRRNVIGRAFNVFWPVTRRWGWIDDLEPLDIPSGVPNPYRNDSQTPTMRLQ